MAANAKDPERYSIEDWRQVCAGVGQMRRWQWKVQSLCDSCGVRLHVNLSLLCLVKGPHFSLWGATTACRRVGCNGTVRFRGQAPGLHGLIDLERPPPRGLASPNMARHVERPRSGR